MLAIILTLIPVFGIMFIGAMAERRQVLPPNAAACLNQFIYWFSLPMLLFYLMASVEMAHISIVPVGGCLLGMLLAQVIGTWALWWRKSSWKDSLMAGLTGCFPNIAYMGIPIVLLLYPNNNEAKAMAGMVALLPTVPLVLCDVLLSLEGKERKGFAHTARNVVRSFYKNPAFVGATCGMVVGFGDIEVPKALMHMADMLGSASAPCALFCMGMSVSVQLRGWKSGMKIQWGQQGVLLIVKLLLTPVFVYCFASALGGTGVSLATMVILSAMPSAVICHIIAVKYQAFEDGCAQSVLIGTLLAVGLLPMVIAIMQMLT